MQISDAVDWYSILVALSYTNLSEEVTFGISSTQRYAI